MDILIIAHFVTEFEKEGTSRFVYIAEQLSQHHTVELVTSDFDHITKRQRTVLNHSLQTKLTLLEEPSYPRNVCFKRFVSHARFGENVKKYLASRKKPDVIYCAVPSLECAYYAAQYAQKNGVRFIVDVQDLWPEAFKMIFRLPLINDILFSPMKYKADKIYSCADVIVGVSKTYCQRAKTSNKKVDKMVPVFLGTKLDNFDQYVVDNRQSRAADEFILGYCGTLGHSYDIRCVLDAMRLIKERGYHKVSFWVMGDGPLKSDFEAYANKHDLKVVFYGRVAYEKMCGLLSSCDVCINPISRGAAQSIINKHGDYAASGLPVINTQEAAEYRELVESYHCGINCHCADSESVAEAIIYLMEHPENRIAMGQNARKLAEELFDRKTSYTKIYELFV